MTERRVRRLPVLDAESRLAGIVSMNDLAMCAECRPKAEVSDDAFLESLKAICAQVSA
jgi:CBS-domain-containing membrane protein